jgi:hypothetical protein
VLADHVGRWRARLEFYAEGAGRSIPNITYHKLAWKL